MAQRVDDAKMKSLGRRGVNAHLTGQIYPTFPLAKERASLNFSMDRVGCEPDRRCRCGSYTSLPATDRLHRRRQV